LGKERDHHEKEERLKRVMGMNTIKVHCVHARKCHNEAHYFVSIYAKKKKWP
jgi:hypothetical protein